MKSLTKITAIIALAFLTFSFTEPVKSTKEVDTAASTVTWKGYKVTGSHTGKITIKSGNLIFDDNALIGGNFVIDMTTITVFLNIPYGLKSIPHDFSQNCSVTM